MSIAEPLVIHSSGRWTLGVLIGIPGLALGLLALLTGFYFADRWRRHRDVDVDGPIPLLLEIFACLAVVALIVGSLFGFYPYDGAYHQYREVDGTVASISSRFLSADKGTDQKFVVTLQGSPQQFGIDDTRASLLKPGDAVTLSCIKEWQYGAQFGYDCNWGKP